MVEAGPGHHDRIPDNGVPDERGLDLAALDPVATDLDLIIETAEKFDVASRTSILELVGERLSAAASARDVPLDHSGYAPASRSSVEAYRPRAQLNAPRGRARGR